MIALSKIRLGRLEKAQYHDDVVAEFREVA